MGAVRQTRADAWRKRPEVLRYNAYKDALRLEARRLGYELKGELYAIFYLPVSKSWSKKKKAAMLYQQHDQKPDCDNMIKGFKDALAKEDKTVWRDWADKYWAEEGYIEVFLSREDFLEAVK